MRNAPPLLTTSRILPWRWRRSADSLVTPQCTVTKSTPSSACFCRVEKSFSTVMLRTALLDISPASTAAW